MNTERTADDKRKILAGVYSSTMSISTTSLAIVAAMEVFMLGYSVVNAPMYQDLLWNYRLFYLCLLLSALAYLGINAYVKSDIEQRYTILNIANPVYACFFFAWALGITFFDAMHWGTVDPMVFMTFSLVVPLSFFLRPSLYAAIAIAVDAIMLYLSITVSGSLAPLTNLSIFCVFQVVLGFSYLRLRLNLAERFLEEQKNADIDVLTGFSNRRMYDQDIKQLANGLPPADLIYVSIDLNGLKEVNDTKGHEAGDKLIVGAAECMRNGFGEIGSLYRIGGDEFVALVHASESELQNLIATYNACLQSWTDENDLTLSTALGYACYSDYVEEGIVELARVADQKMYDDKARYYQSNNCDRRRRPTTTD